MKDLLEVVSPKKAVETLLDVVKLSPSSLEELSLQESLGRIAGEDIFSPEDLPGFSRSTMDGYAVRAQDTFGASEGIPGYLTVIGEVLMGDEATISLSPGQCVKIATGGMLPQGADAVLMVEYTQELSPDMIEVTKGVGPGENMVRQGEDVEKGKVILSRGTKLRPQDLGALAGLGITKVNVFSKPKVAVISTGDELVPSDTRPGPGQIRDINAFALTAQIEELGGNALYLGIVKDSYPALEEKVRQALQEADLVVISGGSSVGTRDVTLDVIDGLGSPGVLIHGVSIRPGKPTILGAIDGKAVYGLPGHPVSAMIIFHVFVTPILKMLTGEKEGLASQANRVLWAKLTRNIPSSAGREDYLRVSLLEKDGELWAEPIFGKSGLIITMVKAAGLVKIPAVKEGLPAGELVEVRVF